MAYVALPIVEVPLDQLRLDLENYRIPTRPQDEAAAMQYLFASEDAVEAAKLILRDGYFDNEVPIVTDDGGYIVLEGNRRVSALKALHDPNIVPASAEAVRTLLRRYATEAQDLPTAIRVLEAPDRESARPHIARLHTGLSKRRWSRDQQATFYYSLLDGHMTVADIKADYPGVEVARFIRMAVMRRFLAGAPFSDPSLRAYVTGDGLAMSSFEYAYRRDEVADAIGVAFARDGQLVPENATPERIAAALSLQQRVALEHLVTEFRAGRLNTRSPALKAGTAEYQALVTRLAGQGQGPPSAATGQSPAPTSGSAQGGTASSTGTTGSASPTPGSAPTPASAQGARGPNHPDTKANLDLAGLDYSQISVNLQYLYHEIRKLKVTEVPVTTSILMRAVLEMTIKWHFGATSTPATGQLSEAFKSVETAYRTEKSLTNAINAIRSGNAQRPGSIKWFNAATHDFTLVIQADDVRNAWKQVSPLLRYLLRPPAP